MRPVLGDDLFPEPETGARRGAPANAGRASRLDLAASVGGQLRAAIGRRRPDFRGEKW